MRLTNRERRVLVKAIRRSVVVVGECWVWVGWNGKCKKRPYMTIRGRQYPVARIILHFLYDLDLNDRNQQALHTCDNRRCVRLTHLYVGTYSDNLLDRYERSMA